VRRAVAAAVLWLAVVAAWSSPVAVGSPIQQPSATSTGAASAASQAPSAGPGSALMPGLPVDPRVDFFGSEYTVQAFASMDCAALAGWLEAGDWLVERTAETPAPSPDASGHVQRYPLTRWLALSRTGEHAIAHLGEGRDPSTCNATISRMTTQPIVADGDMTFATDASAYELTCSVSGAQRVKVAVLYMGDDGSVSLVEAVVPLQPGSNALGETTVSTGRQELTTSALIDALGGLVSSEAFAASLALVRHRQDQGSSASVTIESIDPLIGSFGLGDLVSDRGVRQSFSGGFRCDLPSRRLTEAAQPPVAMPSPIAAARGHLHLTVGTGSDALVISVDGPGVSCTFSALSGADWRLGYGSADGTTGVALEIRDDEPPR